MVCSTENDNGAVGFLYFDPSLAAASSFSELVCDFLYTIHNTQTYYFGATQELHTKVISSVFLELKQCKGLQTLKPGFEVGQRVINSEKILWTTCLSLRSRLMFHEIQILKLGSPNPPKPWGFPNNGLQFTFFRKVLLLVL